MPLRGHERPSEATAGVEGTSPLSASDENLKKALVASENIVERRRQALRRARTGTQIGRAKGALDEALVQRAALRRRLAEPVPLPTTDPL